MTVDAVDSTAAAVPHVEPHPAPHPEPRLGGPPMLSRDGRWWWTGSRWEPVPPVD